MFARMLVLMFSGHINVSMFVYLLSFPYHHTGTPSPSCPTLQNRIQSTQLDIPLDILLDILLDIPLDILLDIPTDIIIDIWWHLQGFNHNTSTIESFSFSSTTSQIPIASKFFPQQSRDSSTTNQQISSTTNQILQVLGFLLQQYLPSVVHDAFEIH